MTSVGTAISLIRGMRRLAHDFVGLHVRRITEPEEGQRPHRLRASGRYQITVGPRSAAYLRTWVRLADNRLLGVSNPVWFLPTTPLRGVPADRKRWLPA